MSVAVHMQPGITDKSRVKIMTVDVVSRRVEAAIKDGSMIQIAIWETGQAFRWPIEGEVWIVRRDNGIWMLDKRVQQAQAETLPITGMSPGEMKLDSSIIFDSQGYRVLATSARGLSLAMVAGTITVINSLITVTSRVFLTRQSGGTNPGAAFEVSRIPEVSFTINSTNGSDTGRVAYWITEP